MLMGNQPYQLLGEVKYGTNPDHRCVHLGTPDAHGFFHTADERPEPLSATNIEDIDLGLRVLRPYRSSQAVAIIKHVNPCAVAIGPSGSSVTGQFRVARLTNPRARHGTLVTAGTVDSSLAAELREHPMHVVAAAGFTPDAVKALSDDNFYASMRSIRLVTLEPVRPARPELRLTALHDGTVLADWHDADPLTSAGLTNPPRGAATADAMLLAYHVTAYCRTISAAVAHGMTIVALTSGHADARSALEAVLSRLERIRPQLDPDLPLVLASDAHFAVADPFPLLREHQISSFVVAGGQAEDGDLARRARTAGIHLSFTHRRVFRH